ncbi:MAG: methylcobalamin:coenzyme M methyltransferase [candidate division BRC1 bacterium ADurb.BinA364]|nr:MAG: methylcobalamin:coenzyme M methyltransferase [candidate division BRC1 bacterium ADurb.BinA364]
MMTPRQRWLASLSMQPVDRLAFWPKLNAGYAPNQGAPFHEMAPTAIMDWIGADKHLGLPAPVRVVRSACSIESRRDGGTTRTIWRTPLGEMHGESRHDPHSASSHPMVFPIKTVDDLRRMKAFYDDARNVLDEEALASARRRREEIGETSSTHASCGISPLMDYVQHQAGVETAHMLLFDHPREARALLSAMHRFMLERVELICRHAPVDAIYMTENTSTSLISPAQYRELNYPHVLEYAQTARRHGRMMILHMCGLLKLILPELATLPVNAFETFTSPPVGNTRLSDGREACPNICLIGGTNAALWLKPAHEIIAEIQRDLEALPHHRGVVVTSAGVMPPACKPETIREVCEWVQAYPARM